MGGDLTPSDIARTLAVANEQRRAELIAKMVDADIDLRSLPLVPVLEEGQAVQLSLAQQQLYFESKIRGGASNYNIARCVVLRGVYERSQFEHAVGMLVRRHAALRLSVHERTADGVPMQELHQASDLQAIVDWQEITAGVDDTFVRKHALEVIKRPFDLSSAPLFRMSCLTDGQSCAVVFCIHHLICDQESLDLLFTEFASLLFRDSTKLPSLVESGDVTYADYAWWQRLWYETGGADKQLRYWCASLSGLDESSYLEPMTTERDRAESPALKQVFQVSEDTRVRIQDLAKRHDCTPFIIFFAAVSLLISRYTDCRDVCVALPVNNRDRPEVQKMVGLFINLMCVRIKFQPATTWSELVALVRQATIDSQNNRDVPFGQIRSALSRAGEEILSSTPQVKFNLMVAADAYPAVDGRVRPIDIDTGTSKFDIEIDVTEAAHGYQVMITQRPGLLTTDAAENLGDRLGQIIDECAGSNSSRLVSEIGAPRPRDFAQLPVPRVTPADTVLQRFMNHARSVPSRLCVTDGEVKLTYADADRNSNILAAELKRKGVGLDVPVGLMVSRPIDFLISAISVWKAGGFYVPIDLDSPEKYQCDTALAAGVRILVVGANSDKPDWLINCQVLEFESVHHSSGVPVAPYAEVPAIHQPLDALAYTIFTSGTTGTPKGVMVSQESLSAYQASIAAQFNIEPGAQMGFISPTSADLGLTTFFGAVYNAGTLHLPPASSPFDPSLVAEYFERHSVDVLKVTPGHLSAMHYAGLLDVCLPKKTLISGGERLAATLVAEIRSARSGVEIHNHYGPTETCVGVITHHVPNAPFESPIIPLGRPLPHVGAAVLDSTLQGVIRGAAGELHISGVSVARGYIARPASTAAAFLPAVYSTERGARMYRTGDRVRIGYDGLLEFIGRKDGELKIHGVRVRPDLISGLLESCPGIRKAVVAIEQRTPNPKLIAYVVGAEEDPSIVDRARDYLHARLPTQLQPHRYVSIEAVPLTKNGKVDHKALSTLEPIERFEPAAETLLQSHIRGVWEEVFGSGPIGLEKNFFELGGDSILSLQIVARLRKHGIVVTPKQMFECQTILALSEVATGFENKGDSTQFDDGQKNELSAEIYELAPMATQFFYLRPEGPTRWNQSVLVVPHRGLTIAELVAFAENLIRIHEALRIAFNRLENGLWSMEVQEAEDVVEQIRRQNAVTEIAIAAVDEIEDMTEKLQQTIDLTVAPLLRIALLSLPNGEQRLFVVAHHLVVDSVSWRILNDEIQAALGGMRRTLSLVEDVSYSTWVAAVRRAGAGKDYVDAQQRWIDEARTTTLWPIRATHPDGAYLGSARREFIGRLDQSYVRRLITSANLAYRTKPLDLLLTALARVLCRLQECRSVAIEIEGHGRDSLDGVGDLSRTIGWFASLIPVVIGLPGGESDIGGSIKHVKELLRHMPDNSAVYTASRFTRSGVDLDAVHASRPRLTFNYLGQFEDGSGSSGMVPAAEQVAPSQAHDALMSNTAILICRISNGELSVRMQYSIEVYDGDVIEAVVCQFVEELRSILDHCAKEENGGVTPSDFKLVKLTQQQLDRIPGQARNIADIYPLSPLQEGILYETVSTDKKIYINQTVVNVSGLDTDRLNTAWQAILRRHDALRTSFIWDCLDGDRVQIVWRNVNGYIKQLDAPSGELTAYEVGRAAAQELEQGLDLAVAPLQKISLLLSSNDSVYLLWTSHHIMFDGWSNSIIIRELLAEYHGQKLSPVAHQYRDYIEWTQSVEKESSEKYWRRMLADVGYDTQLLPLLGSSSNQENVETLVPRYVYRGSDQRYARQLIEFAQSQRLTLNTLVTGAWALTLHRHLGQANISFGCTYAGRPAELVNATDLVGLLINTFPVLSELTSELSVGVWLDKLQRQLLESAEHSFVPLGRIMKLRQDASAAESMFDTLLVFENYPVADVLETGASGRMQFSELKRVFSTGYGLTVLCNVGTEVRFTFCCLDPSVDDAKLEALADDCVSVLGALISARGNIGEVSLRASEKDATDALVKRGGQVNPRRNWFCPPEVRSRVAVECGRGALTYEELDRQSRAVASFLQSLNLPSETRVGVVADRAIEVYAAILGIVRAGYCYVPLDGKLPHDRLDRIVDICGATIILSSSVAPSKQWPSNVKVISLETAISGSPAGFKEPSTHPEQLVYVLFTSGSTGDPKGVGMPERAMATLMEWQIAEDASPYRTLQFASLGFDVSFQEMFITWRTGGRLIVAEEKHREELDLLLDFLVDHRIECVYMPFAVLQPLAELVVARGVYTADLRRIITAGEQLKLTPALKTWLLREPQCQMFNQYGPTETHVVTQYKLVSGIAPNIPPIGSAIAGTVLSVLDRDLNELRTGLAGELFLSGLSVSRGYIGSAARTAERYIPILESQRSYRTGDLVNVLESGELQFLGRCDRQVKINGYRIEPAEIEAAICECKGVENSYVQILHGKGNAKLIAYVVVPDNGTVTVDDVKGALAKRLPQFMLPSRIALVASLPVTRNGKVDVTRLSAPPASVDSSIHRAPRTEEERKILEVWLTLFGSKQIGIDDNFFDLGGDSIVALQAVARLRQAGLAVSTRDIFQAQTIAEIAKLGGARSLPTLTLGTSPRAALPLSPIQHWFFELDLDSRDHWNQSVLLTTRAPLDFLRLRDALGVVGRKHQALALRFTGSGPGQWRQHIDPNGSKLEDLLEYREQVNPQEIADIADVLQTTLNIESGPVFRAALLGLTNGTQRLCMVIHHLVVDGVSWRILLSDLQDAYTGSMARGVHVAELETSYSTWAESLAAYARSDDVVPAEHFWRDFASSVVALDPRDLTLADGRPRKGSGATATSVSITMTAEATDLLLRSSAARYNCQINDVLLAALCRAFCNWSQKKHLFLELEGHGREEVVKQVDLSRTVGWFTSMYPVLLAPRDGLAESVKAVRYALRSIPNRGIDFGILKYLGPDDMRDLLAQLPVPSVSFNYLGQFDSSFGQNSIYHPAKEKCGRNTTTTSPLRNWITVGGKVFEGRLSFMLSVESKSLGHLDARVLGQLFESELLEFSKDIANDPSVSGDRSLDDRVATRDAAGGSDYRCGVEPCYKLSPMQEGMLFSCLSSENRSLYVNQLLVQLDTVDPVMFENAWNTVISRWSVLRATFHVDGLGRYFQTIQHTSVIRVNIIGAGVPKDALESHAQAVIRAEREMIAPCGSGPLMRLTLIHLEPHRTLFVWTFHHLILDGWSVSKVLGEVMAKYNGEELPVGMDVYPNYLSQLAESPAESSLLYWRSRLSKVKEACFVDTASGNLPEANAAQQSTRVTLTAAVTTQLRGVANRHRVTLNTVVQFAWGLCLARLTGRNAVCFGITTAGRSGSDPTILSAVGMFINTIPLVMEIDETEGAVSAIQNLQSNCLDDQQHGDVPLYRILSEWGERASGMLFDSVLVFENYATDTLLKAGATNLSAAGGLQTRTNTGYPLCGIVHAKSSLSIDLISWQPGLSVSVIEFFAESLDEYLTALSQDENLPIGKILSNSRCALDSYRVINRHESNGQDCTLVPILGHDAVSGSRSPFEPSAGDRVAVSLNQQELSYGQLQARFTAIAAYLQSIGLPPEAPVGVMIEREIDTYAAIAGIVSAGYCYVPLDGRLPPARLDRIVELSGMKIILVHDTDPSQKWSPKVQTISIEAACASETGRFVEPSIHPEQLIYILFTSGSTGSPKGVAMSHGAMAALLNWQMAETNPAHRTLQFASLGFDVSFQEMFGTWRTTGNLIVADDEQRQELDRLVALVIDRRIECVYVPFAVLQPLAELVVSLGVRTPDLKRLITAGEQLKLTPALKTWLSHEPQCQLLNQYGPTETHVVTQHKVQLTDPVVVPIGKVTDFANCLILGDSLREVPRGRAGELFICGKTISRGYIGSPSQTAGRYLPDLRAKEGRMYASGDLAVIGVDGALNYLGRRDRQLKIRGFRVEVGEIEGVLGQHPSVRDAVVKPFRSQERITLVAYVVLRENQPSTETDLIDFLRRRLPEYMIPTSLVLLEGIPLTANGKVDVASLLAPEEVTRESADETLTETETQVRQVWASVLGSANIGLDDNFFELGGHSLLATQVSVRIASIFAAPVPVRLVFVNPTIREFAAQLDRHVLSNVAAESTSADELDKLLSEMASVEKRDDSGS